MDKKQADASARTFTDHTFVICAYKESEYLETCIRSIMRQTVTSFVLMVTSTPNEHIRGLARKYGIPLIVREGQSNIKDDWNAAYDAAATKWVTVAHQDDIYSKKYLEVMHETVTKYKVSPMAFVSDYRPVDADGNHFENANSRIRRLLRTPLRIKSLSDVKVVKKAILALGNSICCPAVTYNKEMLGDSYFTSDKSFNIDWDTFLKMAGEKGAWAYSPKILLLYRMHKDATSKEFIDDGGRAKEDREMFLKFWPKPVVDVLMKFYTKAYDAYK